MASVYEIVSDRFIAEMEKGIVPWRKPWTGVRSGAIKHTTGEAYSLINKMMLGEPGEYLGYKQIQRENGKIKAGEEKKYSIVVFWKPLPVKETTKDGKEVTKVIPFLRYDRVWHINQCEGIKPKYDDSEKLKAPANPIAKAESTLGGYVAKSGVKLFIEKSNKAYYSPMLDEIHVPLREQFGKIAEFYSMAFHESVHSTGHKSRLDRIKSNAHFGNEEYSKEELVAEIGAACLMNELGIETPDTFRNSSAYVQNWLTVLKKDKTMIVSAAGKAEKAAKMILGIEEGKK